MYGNPGDRSKILYKIMFPLLVLWVYKSTSAVLAHSHHAPLESRPRTGLGDAPSPPRHPADQRPATGPCHQRCLALALRCKRDSHEDTYPIITIFSGTLRVTRYLVPGMLEVRTAVRLGNTTDEGEIGPQSSGQQRVQENTRRMGPSTSRTTGWGRRPQLIQHYR